AEALSAHGALDRKIRLLRVGVDKVRIGEGEAGQGRCACQTGAWNADRPGEARLRTPAGIRVVDVVVRGVEREWSSPLQLAGSPRVGARRELRHDVDPVTSTQHELVVAGGAPSKSYARVDVIAVGPDKSFGQACLCRGHDRVALARPGGVDELQCLL